MTPRRGASSPSIGTEIEGLPHAISFLSGSCYALSIACADVADTLIWSLLAGICMKGSNACFITPGSVKQSHMRSGLNMQDNALLSNPLLTLLELNDGSHWKDAMQQSRCVLEDLQHFEGRKFDVLVIDSAEHFLPVEYGSALVGSVLAQWRTWAESRGTAIVFLFRQQAAKEAVDYALLDRVAHLLSGISVIHSLSGTTLLEVVHWFGVAGLQTRTCYPLCLDKKNGLSGCGARRPGTSPPHGLSDEGCVFVQKAVVPVQETLEPSWQLLDDDFNRMLEQMQGARAATTILVFSKRTRFAELARAVHMLRQQCGSRLKVIIREVGACLRSTEEEIVLRLGANLVVPFEVSHARLQSMTIALQGQIYSLVPPVPVDQAFIEAAYADQGGYLAPPQFVIAVRKMLRMKALQRAKPMLLRLEMADGLLPLDGLACLDMQRAGDFVSCDDCSLYLFFQACNPGNLGTTLDRLFGSQYSELIASDATFSSDRAIDDALNDLERRHHVEQFPDLSTEFAVRGLRGMPDDYANRSTTEAVDRSAFRAPEPAVPRPLLMKGPPPLAVIAGLSS